MDEKDSYSKLFRKAFQLPSPVTPGGAKTFDRADLDTEKINQNNSPLRDVNEKLHLPSMTEKSANETMEAHDVSLLHEFFITPNSSQPDDVTIRILVEDLVTNVDYGIINPPRDYKSVSLRSFQHSPESMVTSTVSVTTRDESQDNKNICQRHSEQLDEVSDSVLQNDENNTKCSEHVSQSDEEIFQKKEQEKHTSPIVEYKENALHQDTTQLPDNDNQHSITRGEDASHTPTAKLNVDNCFNYLKKRKRISVIPSEVQKLQNDENHSQETGISQVHEDITILGEVPDPDVIINSVVTLNDMLSKQDYKAKIKPEPVIFYENIGASDFQSRSYEGFQVAPPNPMEDLEISHANAPDNREAGSEHDYSDYIVDLARKMDGVCTRVQLLISTLEKRIEGLEKDLASEKRKTSRKHVVDLQIQSLEKKVTDLEKKLADSRRDSRRSTRSRYAIEVHSSDESESGTLRVPPLILVRSSNKRKKDRVRYEVQDSSYSRSSRHSSPPRKRTRKSLEGPKRPRGRPRKTDETARAVDSIKSFHYASSYDSDMSMSSPNFVPERRAYASKAARGDVIVEDPASISLNENLGDMRMKSHNDKSPHHYHRTPPIRRGARTPDRYHDDYIHSYERSNGHQCENQSYLEYSPVRPLEHLSSVPFLTPESFGLFHRCSFCWSDEHITDMCDKNPLLENREHVRRALNLCPVCLVLHPNSLCISDLKKPCAYCSSEEHHMSLCPSEAHVELCTRLFEATGNQPIERTNITWAS